MNIPEYLSLYPEFFNQELEVQEVWEKVFSQALEHNERTEESRSIKDFRPNEDATVHEYRQNNRRLFSFQGPERYANKISRLFNGSGVSISEDDLSDVLKEYLETNPYKCLGQNTSLLNYFYRYIFRLGLKDANSLWLAFPTSPNNANTPPSYHESLGGGSPNKKVLPVSREIMFSDIVLIPEGNSDVFGWHEGFTIVMDGKTEKECPYYILCDTLNWYRYAATSVDKDKKPVYEIEVWYEHNTGSLPINWVPGDLKEWQGHKYQESFIHSFYELADEANARASDNQAVETMFAHPKTVSVEFRCTAQGCSNGKVKTYKADGKIKGIEDCGNCHGSGIEPDIGPYGKLIIPDRSNNINKGSNQKPLELIHADVGILDHSYNVPKDLYLRASQSIGLDILQDVGESGVAKDKRLEDLLDILNKVLINCVDCIERHLWHLECLLQVSPDKRVRPKLIKPQTLSIKSESMLLEDLKNTIPSNKLQSALDYIQKAYEGRPEIIKMYELAYCYCPLLLMDEALVSERFAGGVYGSREMIKNDYCITAFKEVAKDIDILNANPADIFKRVDEWLEQFMPQQAVTLFDDNGNPITGEAPQEESELLQRVGGITGAIEINRAVAEGTMTEAAAEKLLMKFFKISAEEAAQLIEVNEELRNASIAAKTTPQPNNNA